MRPPETIIPASNILRLWFSRISDTSVAVEDSLQPMLSDSELKRLEAIGGKTRRREYLLSRALMRHALSQTFQRQDSDWNFNDLPQSMPVVTNLPENTHISLSHSKGFICFAISDRALGVDLEATDGERNFPALAKAFMNPQERACLVRDPTQQADYFYRVWSAKEAGYKWLSSEQRAVKSLRQIDYSDLVDSGSRGYLFEGGIDGFVVAAVTTERPQQVSCNYYLMAEQRLRQIDCPSTQA